QILTTAILGADGTVYATSGAQGPGGDAVYALDANGNLLWDYRTGGHIMGSPALGIDGAIVATSFSEPSPGSFEASLHAIQEMDSASGQEGSPWPQERGSRANTGRAGG